MPEERPRKRLGKLLVIPLELMPGYLLTQTKARSDYLGLIRTSVGISRAAKGARVAYFSLGIARNIRSWPLNSLLNSLTPFLTPLKLTFFNPSKVFEQARKVYLFTVDVSDVVPVMVGSVRSWFVR